MAPLCDSCVSDFEAPVLHLHEAARSPFGKTGSMEAVRGNTTTTTETTTVRSAYSVRAERAVWLVTGIVTALLIIRFAFKLLAASTQASFVTFIYDLTQVFIALSMGSSTPLRMGATSSNPSRWSPSSSTC